MQREKITIFDSGPGMDAANGNIAKWYDQILEKLSVLFVCFIGYARSGGF